MVTFVGDCPEGKEVNHKNGIKTDNRLGNLEYVTTSQNIKHSYVWLGRKRLVGERNPSAKLTIDQVRAIRAMRQQGETVPLITAQFGVSRSTVYDICERRTWKEVD
jgi:hypothetical protein